MRRRRHWPVWCLALCILLVPGHGVRSDTYPRQAGIDIQHYVFSINLEDGTDRISGDAAIHARFTAPGLKQVELDLVEALNGRGMTVRAASVEGQPARFEHAGRRVRIELGSVPAAGERRVLSVRYDGIPADGLRIGTNKYGDRNFSGLNWPDKARHWLPLVDHPYDKATSEFRITAPVRYQVVANGLLFEERDLPEGRRLTHWKQSVPIASWLNAIQVAPMSATHYGSLDGIPLSSWVFPQDREKGTTTFEGPTRQALKLFIERIGPYPYEKLANVQSAGMTGGTEHASVIFYGEDSVTDRPATSLVAHEIAHQWFGNSVTESDWDDVWLSEGFATYLALAFAEHYSGDLAFRQGLRRSREIVLAAEAQSPGTPVIHSNISDMSGVLNSLVYQKGAWVLHMLRGEMGDERFWQGIREYYTRFRDSNASTEDFRRVMEGAAALSLDSFFDQWLRRPGSPVVEWDWRYDRQRRRVIVDVRQTQAGPAFRLPIEFESAGVVRRLEMTGKQGSLEWDTERPPDAVMIDPGVRVLIQAVRRGGSGR